MLRKVFASFGLAGAIALALSLYFAVGANAASYTVKDDDCLWSIARRATCHGINYVVIVDHNFPADRQPRRYPHLIFTGESLWIPDSWAVALGIVPAPAVVETAPVVPVLEPIPTAEPVWPALLGLILGLAAFAVMAMGLAKFRPWNWFRPERVGEPVAEGGVRNPEHAAELLRSQAPAPVSPLESLRRVRIFGVIEVAGADGRFQTRVCAGDEAWEGRFRDGSVRYVLDACANPLRLGKGGRLLSGHVVPFEEVLVPPPSVEHRPVPREPRPEPVVVVPPRPKSAPQFAPVVVALQPAWNLTPTVLKQGPKKGELILEPVWRVPDPA